MLNKPFVSCSFTNLDILIPQTGHFACILTILFFCSNHFWISIFSIFSTLHAINLHLTFIILISKALNYFLLLYFCFKNLDLFDRQTTQLYFCLSTWFVIFISCGPKLWVKSLHPRQYVVPGLFPIFIGFIFTCFLFFVIVLKDHHLVIF